MNDPDFIYLNDFNFGLWERKNKQITKGILNQDIIKKRIEKSIRNDIKQLVDEHRSKLNLLHNYKYLNNVHMYYLYEQTYKIQDNNPSLNILRYKQDLSILCNNILIEKSHYSNNFKFTKLSNISSQAESFSQLASFHSFFNSSLFLNST